MARPDPLASFLPETASWFREEVGEPAPVQAEAWARIRTGGHVLVAAPTGSGKTLAAFLHALDGLLRQGEALEETTQVLYVSPLKALGNDIRRNLETPLARLRERAPHLPELRVAVRSGDTPASERSRMLRRPPHVLVTTPESLYLLLTSEGGRRLLERVRTVIVDEIHAVLGDKRGSHLALSLERLEALCGREVQRIGLSATQKPLEEVGRFLVGAGRRCSLVDHGHARPLDLAVEIPDAPLETVCSHETFAGIYRRVAQLVEEHRSTLVFVSTRKMAERTAARLSEILGEERVGCHHSSLSKERRLAAEQALKEGRLPCLVATASLELGIDIGDVDLAVQLGTPRSIASFLQRVGRSGHGVGRVPKGRLFPLTRDELVAAAALMRAVRRGLLDRTPQPRAPRDILAQQIVAECAARTWDEEELFQRFRRAWPWRELRREDFDRVVALHTAGRGALLHRDGVRGRLRGTRRARLTALTSGGAIPDTADYRVVLEPEGTFLGTVDEDFAVEASAGDVFQLGNASWQVLKVESGTMRVADAAGAPPSLPFWFGEAPARTRELSEEIGRVREHGREPGWLERECGLEEPAARQIRDYLAEGEAVLGCIPSPTRLVLERFFDESGGMQVVLHAPLGGRINRALGLAIRKRFCRSFGFELQAAANEEALVLSLSRHHSFPLEEVFDYVPPERARDVLVQAVLPTPWFTSRWRWNAQRALVLPRQQGGRRVPPPIQRMKADDLLAAAFPQVVACGENLPPGDLPVPWDHPLVAQTLEDCLHEAMDLDGMVEVLEGLRDGRIERAARDTPEPSAFARSILQAMPYAFLDDAPLEERRTQAVARRRLLDPATVDRLGELDPAAVEQVRREAWPDPRDAEELHETLLWIGYLTEEEAAPWQAWVRELETQGRVVREQGRLYAAETDRRDAVALLRGRLQALGPVEMEDPALGVLEAEGTVLRARLQGRQVWCERRLLARILQATLEDLRERVRAVPAASFLAFLGRWQHLDEETRLEGPAGVAEALTQLAGFEAPAAAWERAILQRRVRDYDPSWLDGLCAAGEITWGRLWGAGHAAPRALPVAFFPREDLAFWEGLAGPSPEEPRSVHARALAEALAERGALFSADLAPAAGPLRDHFERGLAELLGLGRLHNDSFEALRFLFRPAHRRRTRLPAGGRWSLFRTRPRLEAGEAEIERLAFLLLRRYGVVFRRVLERERLPVPWRDLHRVLRRLELRGEVRGGRFVAGFSGEQFALPGAVEELRRTARREAPKPLRVAAADPLNLEGILTPEKRVPSGRRRTVDLVPPAAEA